MSVPGTIAALRPAQGQEHADSDSGERAGLGGNNGAREQEHFVGLRCGPRLEEACARLLLLHSKRQHQVHYFEGVHGPGQFATAVGAELLCGDADADEKEVLRYFLSG